MSLERKDVRVKFDAADHAALALIAEIDVKEISEWIEIEVTKLVRRRIHEATVIAERAKRLGLSGSGGD